MSRIFSLRRRGPAPIGAGLCVLLALLAVGMTSAGAEDEALPLAFDTPEAAAQALVRATVANDDDALKSLFGPRSEDLVLDGKDPVVASERAQFARAATEKLTIEKAEGRAVLVVGNNGWPLPVPLVVKDGKWSFDAEAGREEILARRIGRNELEAIDICKAYAAAQVTYAAEDRDGDGVREYAQKIVSTPGQRDGLFWESEAEDVEMSPLGPLVASLDQFLATGGKDGPAPFGGYYWKILPGQGPHAPGGAHSYVINGNMIAGFALVGVPARYMNTGVMTFLVSHHGKVLERDLGEKSLEIVKAMEVYDPDDTWRVPKGEEE